MEEKKKCTFHPRVNDDGRRYEDPQELFERLFQENKIRTKIQGKREQIKAAKEVYGCTFTPKRIAVKHLQSSMDNQNEQSKNPQQIFQRLYQNHEEIKKNIQLKKIIQEEKSRQSLTFTPQLFSSSYSSRSNNQALTPTKQQQKFEDLYQDSYRKQEKITVLREEKERMQREQSLSQRKRSNSACENRSSSVNRDEKPRYEQLYEKANGKKERMRKLEVKVNEECGITFNPKRYTSLSQRSFSGNQQSNKFYDQSEDSVRKNNKAIITNKKAKKVPLPPKPSRL